MREKKNKKKKKKRFNDDGLWTTRTDMQGHIEKCDKFVERKYRSERVSE